MARINEAWYVLRDPARRAVYDASRRPPAEHRGPGADDHVGDGDEPPDELLDEPFDEAFGEAPGLGRRGFLPLPWILAIVVLGVIFVFTAYATADRGSGGSPVDGVLQPGSCVDVDGRFAREVGCDGAHDGVVDALATIGAECRPGMLAYEDPRASSTVCVRLV